MHIPRSHQSLAHISATTRALQEVISCIDSSDDDQPARPRHKLDYLRRAGTSWSAMLARLS